MKTKEEIKAIVRFCILMESNGGILNQAPPYINEKFRRYIEGGDSKGLDNINTKKFEKYCKIWEYDKEE